MSFTSQLAEGEERSKVDLNRLEPSFKYTTLFKRILLDMKYETDERKAIWWYTRECFTYQMLNRALRLLESDIIIDMGFFIYDLYQQLEQLHQDQFSDYHSGLC